MYTNRAIATLLLAHSRSPPTHPHPPIGTIRTLTMIEETLHAANWWVQKIISYNINVEAPSWQSHFEKVMIGLLRAKYHNHWYCDDPSRGSGYRAISNEYALDPILDKAAKAVSHSLPKNLARVVLTSEDRWLTMFVNPGQVTVRNKHFLEEPVYDPRRHICNKGLLQSSQSHSRKHRKSHRSASFASKSDDDTLGTLDEREAKTGAKSDPEDNNGNGDSNGNSNEKLDFKRIFLEKIHNTARLNKEKEIEAHVEAYRKELKLEQPDLNGSHSASASASLSASASASNRSSLTLEDAASDNRLSLSPSKCDSTASSPAKTPSQSNSHSGTDNHSQILKLLSANNIERHNLSGQTHELLVDTDHSNYGKHLSRILNACRIHRRNMEREYTPSASASASASERSVESSPLMQQAQGMPLSDHPDLLFSSRSQPLSIHSHSHDRHDHNALNRPPNGKHPNGKHTNGTNGKAQAKAVIKSLLNFDLDAHQSQVFESKAVAAVQAVYHESEVSEIASNQDASCNSSPIYDSATPPTPTHDEQNASPSSKGGSDSGIYVGGEELKF